ncbi:TRAP transporter permease [Mangrovitalea sediminis]|uniref:TRAP transporter permease n=1 Tax=Mangrovitalea sediminis TaxID=1982043 RepID=UPI000BE548D7|nr:TRAP transporter permease [Mangrovitalea sediminis]
MTNDKTVESAPSKEVLEDLIAEADTGARKPGPIAAKVIVGVALAWSLFQLWFASPLPFIFNIGVFNYTEARSIHLAFAVFLAFTAYPALKGSPRHYIPLQDWVFAFVGAFCAAYLFLFYDQLANRPGLPTTMDVVVAVVGIVLLLEATRRALGPPLMVVALVFIGYAFLGPYMPDIISHKAVTLDRGMSQYWLGTEGVFGVALGVSTSMVFLFVLFGALLEKVGAGNYFIRVAFSLLGHLRGGPAKAAVVSSASTGMISGSSIANVVTTGTFTIPLMKRVGFPAYKAGAIECASSVNGQLTPPVMGAAAFLMVEYVGIPYTQVIKAAALPALIAYMALFYIVHLEALKMDLKGLPRLNPKPWHRSLISFVMSFFGMVLVTGAVYYGVGWTKEVFGSSATWILGAALMLVYVGLVAFASRLPDLDEDPEFDVLPEAAPTIKSGLYYLLPVVVLVWCLAVERLSPDLSAFWATIFLMIVAVTHRPLKSLFRKSGDMAEMAKKGCMDVWDGLINGGRNMIGIGVATAAAGIVVGTVTLTGIGLVMTEFVGYISGGNLMLVLLFTAMISLLLGMGLPTTANYIVVSTLMAPVIVHLGAQSGLVVPLIAVHMFVFYFGILADDTPPVGLAAYAAAAIARSEPIKTGFQGFIYDIRTAILPFMFIFNNELLLIGVHSVSHFLLVFISALLAMMAFASGTQGYFITRCRWYETVGLLLVAFTLFRPGFWMDMVQPEYKLESGAKVLEAVKDLPDNSSIRVRVVGDTIEGNHVDKIVILPLGKQEASDKRLMHAGLSVSKDGDNLLINNVNFGSTAQKLGIGYGWEITSVQVKTHRPAKQWMFVPALLLLGGIAWRQNRRRKGAQPQAIAA